MKQNTFFEIKRNKTKTKPPCEKCGLYKNCKSPKMEAGGEGKLKVLIIAEAPGKEEDYEGDQLVGKSGKFIERKLAKYGLKLHEDFNKINAVNCRPLGNKTPSLTQIKCCKEYMVDRIIQDLKPKFIILAGKCAIQSFYADKFSRTEINRWRNLCIPDRKTKAWILPIMHPAAVLRRGDKNTESVFDRDIKFIASCIKNRKRPTFIDFDKKINPLYDIKEVKSTLKKIIKEKPIIAFDYEANRILPYWNGSQILSIAISFNESAYSFPFEYNEYWDQEQLKSIRELWSKILNDKEVKKICHNFKFEQVWSNHFFLKMKECFWCTMNAAHIIDSRKRFSGLKFQGYINFGVGGYEKEAYVLMKKDSFGFNYLHTLPLEKLLQYNGMDALLTWHLYNKQKKYFDRNKPAMNALKLTHNGLFAFAESQDHGISVDDLYYKETDEDLKDKIEKIEKRLLKGKEAKLFKEKTGKDLVLKKDFSSNDLRKILFDILGETPTKQTATGMNCIDAEVLSNMKNSFAKRVVQRRKLYKIKNTYIHQFIKFSANGKIHPFLDLHTTQTYRSSSSEPNFHNIPIRDEEAKAIIRKGIVPSYGNQFACADFGSQEVRIIACYSKDKNLINYVKTGFDMHKEQAKKLFALNDNQITGQLRFYAKNQFVFPEFYGSYFVTCCRNLMEQCFNLKTEEGIPVWKHLKNEGIIKSKNDKKRYEYHVKKIEKELWSTFPEVKDWQERTIEFYQKKGYVDSFFGHRRSGLLSINQIINSPIQGTAFHLLLWCYIKLNRIAKRKWFTKLVAQIHDEIIFDMNPREKEEVLETTKRVMEKDTQKTFPWLIAPLEAEIELTEPNQAWYYKKEFLR